MRYPVVIHKDADSDYGVSVPDLPGCFSAGESVEEAIACVTEAIECHTEGTLMQNQYFLWAARQNFDSNKLSPLDRASA
jgi:predicted RNase H-like HicB family nuclease